MMAASPPRPRSRRRSRIGLAVAVVAGYLASAVVSGHLSPLARHPVLDGFGTPQAYRWVNPPPDQAASNQKPGSASTTLRLADGASGYVFTPDGQAALIVGKRTFQGKGAAGQTGVLITISPLDPRTLGKLPPHLESSGNAYRVKTSFQPSGQAISAFTAPVTLLLIYPAIASSGIRPPPRTILWSKAGASWTKLPTQDSHQGLQAVATIRAPGTFLVATAPIPAAATTNSRLRLLAIGIMVGLAVFVLAGIAYVLRTRRRGAT
jgi:hypothetical protein